MAAAVDNVVAAVAASDTVVNSAIVYINSVPQLIQTAVTAALNGGATAAELAPLTALVTDLQAKSSALQAALTANTPTPPVPVVPPTPVTP
jgi:hypothetical protein